MFFSEHKEIQSILDVQGGNRGFGHLANKLIVVTADLSVFFGTNERYQAYIDGGMFAMNLLYALHYEEIAACVLNCSHSAEKDKRMRSVCHINDSEVFIAMISCGKVPENFRIPVSFRSPIESYVKLIQ